MRAMLADMRVWVTLDSSAKDPSQFIKTWLESQSCDLESILGNGPIGGLAIRQEELRGAEFFQSPWVEEVRHKCFLYVRTASIKSFSSFVRLRRTFDLRPNWWRNVVAIHSIVTCIHVFLSEPPHHRLGWLICSVAQWLVLRFNQRWMISIPKIKFVLRRCQS